MRSVVCCLLAAGVVLARPAFADDGELAGTLKFRVFGGDEGLTNLVVTSIAQDARGLLWVGTDDGVYRFDGERFTHFSIEDGLDSSMINTIGIAPDGQPCVGSQSGLACWTGARFSRTALSNVPVRAIASFRGALWVGADTGLLQRAADGSFAIAGSHAAVRTMWSDSDELVVGDGSGVHFTAGDGRWHDVSGIDTDRVDGVIRDREGTLWIRTPSHMWRVPRGSASPTDLRDGLPPGYDSVYASGHMAIDSHGQILVGTDSGVAYRDNNRWRVIDRAAGIPAASVRTLLVDREGTMWIGAKGLVQLRGRGLIERFDADDSMPGEVTWGIQRDREGTLWAGTSHCLARAAAGRWTCLPGTEGRIVRSFVFPAQGGVFVGGAPSDLLYLDDDGHATSVGDFGGRSGHNILAMALAGVDLWIATVAGLYRLPGAVPGPIEHVVIPGTRPADRFASLAVIGDRLWTATQEGVLVLDHGAWHRFDSTAGFRASSMRYVIGRADGRLCAAYTEAIGITCFRYDGRAVSQLEHVTVATGLTSGMVYFLGEDRRERLWVGTGDGIDVVTPNGIDHFDESDGIAGNDSAATAFFFDRDGSVWLGSTGGATHVFAQRYAGPPAPPRVELVDGVIGDVPLANVSPGVELAHDHNSLIVDLGSSTLIDRARVEYQVRLSPVQTEWSTTRHHELRYPALVPGSYHFEVRARIGAGTWGELSELSFVVTPAWWQSRLFIWSLVLTGLAAIGTAFAVRQRVVIRRRTRQLLDRSEASFRAVIDVMPDLISMHRDAKLIYVNRSLRRFHGFEDGDDGWQDLDLLSRVHPDDRERTLDLFTRVVALDVEAPRFIETRFLAGDGSWRTCELSGILVDIAGLATVVASSRDITERNRLRSKLLVSDRMASLGTLAAGIAHEINNPLTYVMGNLEVVAESVAAIELSTDSDGVDLQAAIADARDGAERVRKIVLGLRAFSRSEEEMRRPLDIAEVLESAIKLTANDVRHRARLVREIGPTPVIVADDGRLTQVFINLLVNAAHAIPEGHSDDNRIVVRTSTDAAGCAVIEIEDSGAGIEPALRARVFDPFFTTKEVGVGTGLGLSICHGIISGLDGQIAIEAAPVRGTIVRVVLPSSEPVPEPAPPPTVDAPVPASAERRPRVMVVDDEPLVAHMIERVLAHDYDVTVALCGADAVGHLTDGKRFDAIVSDVMMPNMTGLELADHIRRVAPDQADRMIFLSGGVFASHTREMIDHLDLPQLAKPIGAAALRSCVQVVTSR